MDIEPLVEFVGEGINCVFKVCDPYTYYVGVEPQYSLMLSYLNLLDDYI